jgi:ADP-ribose pyrophosphatase
MNSDSEPCNDTFINYQQWKDRAKICYSTKWFNVLENESYYSIEHKEDQVMVLPILEYSKILLVKARRPVLGKSLWELPAGGVKNGESHVESAKREMAEETGIKIANLDRFHESQSFVLASNRMPMFPKVFYINLTNQEYLKKDEFDEEIEQVKAFSFEETVETIVQGDLFATLPIAVISKFLFTRKLHSPSPTI